MTDSAKDELVEFQKRKEELVNRIEAVKRDRNTLEEEIRILREKAAIRELEEQLREEQNALSKLSFEKQELEEGLNQPNKFSTVKTIEQTQTEREGKQDTYETERTEQPITEEMEQPETHAGGKEQEEKSESDKEPEEQENKKKLKFF